MTLFQIIQILKQIALTQPNIKSVTDGSIYEVMNTNPSIKYNVVHFSQTTHQSDEETDVYGLNIFYVSRLEDSLEDNRLQIQSIGKDILDNIIRTFCENWNIDFPVITYTPFTQKFNDLCAGCYCNLKLEIPKEILCADDYLAEVVPNSGLKLHDIGITITENGLRVITPGAEYDGIGEIRVKTEVPQVITSEDLVANIQGDYFVIPEGTTKIRNYALYYTCFSSITIPDSVENIGPFAFALNNCLTSITIPASVTYVGIFCFHNCDNLSSMTFEGLTPPLLAGPINSLGSTAYTFPIYVPCVAVDAYKTAFGEGYAPRIRCKEEQESTEDTANTTIP